MTTAIANMLTPVDLAACYLAGRQLTTADRESLGVNCSHDVDVVLQLSGKVIVGKQPAGRLAGGCPADVLGYVLSLLPDETKVAVANAVHDAACKGVLKADPTNRSIATGLIDLTKKISYSSAQLSGCLDIEVA